MRSHPLLPGSIQVAEESPTSARKYKSSNEIVMLITAHDDKDTKEDIIYVSLGVALVAVVT